VVRETLSAKASETEVHRVGFVANLFGVCAGGYGCGRKIGRTVAQAVDASNLAGRAAIRIVHFDHTAVSEQLRVVERFLGGAYGLQWNSNLSSQTYPIFGWEFGHRFDHL
jgi:hypothetical protein